MHPARPYCAPFRSSIALQNLLVLIIKMETAVLWINTLLSPFHFSTVFTLTGGHNKFPIRMRLGPMVLFISQISTFSHPALKEIRVIGKPQFCTLQLERAWYSVNFRCCGFNELNPRHVVIAMNWPCRIILAGLQCALSIKYKIRHTWEMFPILISVLLLSMINFHDGVFNKMKITSVSLENCWPSEKYRPLNFRIHHATEV